MNSQKLLNNQAMFQCFEVFQEMLQIWLKLVFLDLAQATGNKSYIYIRLIGLTDRQTNWLTDWRAGLSLRPSVCKACLAFPDWPPCLPSPVCRSRHLKRGLSIYACSGECHRGRNHSLLNFKFDIYSQLSQPCHQDRSKFQTGFFLMAKHW